MIKLRTNQLDALNSSIDQIGQVYFFEDRVLRGIKSESKEHVLELFSSGLIDELVSNKLFPETIISSFCIEGYSLVLEHEKIINWNYSCEWTFDMLKEASFSVLKINEISNKYSFELFDCHRSNVTFKGTCPIYVDLGSFKRTTNPQVWSGYEIFYNSYYIPIKLMSIGYNNVARNILLSTNYFDTEEFLNIVYPRIPKKVISLYANYRLKALSFLTLSLKEQNDRFKGYKKLIVRIFKNFISTSKFGTKKLKRKISGLNLKSVNSTWGDYHNSVEANKSNRFNKVLKIFMSLEDEIETILELAANQGKLSRFILDNSNLKQAIATDYDSNAVNTMFIKNKGVKNFLPLLIDFMKPEGRIIDDDFNKRLRSDAVIALAVTHHLVLTQNYSLEDIFKKIKDLTNIYVFIDFMPLGLYSGDLENIPPKPSFYNLEWFRVNFENHFELIMDEELEINRHLFVGKIKK